MTADGQAMVALAHGILEANERARQYFAISELRGRLRFGAAEDFVRSRLPEVLRDFTRIHRAIDLELRVDLSGCCFKRSRPRNWTWFWRNAGPVRIAAGWCGASG